MTFPVVGSNIPSAYQISNSLRFNRSDSAYLSRSLSSTSTTWTFSSWVKRSKLGDGTVGTTNYLISWGNSGTDATGIQFNRDNEFAYYSESSPDNKYKTTSGVYRDTSAWYHLICQCSSNAITLYVNGEEPTQSWVVGSSANPLDTSTMNIGKWVTSAYYHDGYMAETYFIEGQALSPTDFGEFDEDSGVWKPKQYAGTYGTNGFYLKFNNTGNLGEDSSGNDNTFTPTNLSGTTDVTTDTPTNNFARLNPLTPVVTHTLSEANLKSTNSSGTHGGATATINYPTSGKWYHEVRINAEDSSKGQGVAIGNQIYRDVTEWGNYRNLIGYFSDGSKQTDGGYSSYGVVHNVGDIIGVAYNADDQELTFYHDNSSQGTITTSEMDGTIDFNNLCPIVFGRNMGQTFNFGQDSSFAGAETRQNNSDGNGYGDFYYAPPSGYLALCTQNLATALSPTIDDGSAYFQTALWSGTGGALTVTNDGNSDLKPDFLWVKNRNNAGGHRLHDSNRPLDNTLKSHTSDAEGTETDLDMTFETDGFSLDKNAGDWNFSGRTYVGWQWKANAGTTSSNTDGSITSTVQANTTAGFSIVTYTGTGANATIGHGLNKPPEWIMIKRRDTTGEWIVYQKSFSEDGSGEFNLMNLNDNDATQEFGAFNFMQSTSPTSSVFYTDGQSEMNASGGTYVAYCFNNVEGYSKFGSYTGNGNADGTFIYTGFRPAWVMIKKTSGSANWFLYDTKRNPHNLVVNRLIANGSEAENTGSGDDIDILSNGWKARASASALNGNGDSFIYMAFAENPFVTSGAVPVTAR